MAKAYLFLAVFFLYACGDQQEEKTQKQEVPAASKHSTAFNASIQAALQSYYNLTEAFVKWDSAAVPAAGTDLETKLDSIRLDELSGVSDDLRITLIGIGQRNDLIQLRKLL